MEGLVLAASYSSSTVQDGTLAARRVALPPLRLGISAAGILMMMTMMPAAIAVTANVSTLFEHIVSEQIASDLSFHWESPAELRDNCVGSTYALSHRICVRSPPGPRGRAVPPGPLQPAFTS